MITIILAGGQGKRMNSGTTPKVLVEVYHPIRKNTHPMLIHILCTADEIPNNKIVIVVNEQNRDIIRNKVEEYLWECPIEYIVQGDLPGTAGAVRACLSYMTHAFMSEKETRVLILSGDVPLISSDTLTDLLYYNGNALLYTDIHDPVSRKGNGRLIFWESHIEKIVEEKDCSPEQRDITSVNCGIYVFQLLDIISHIVEIGNQNKAGEYYLTDLIEILWNHQRSVRGIELPADKAYEVININTPADLERIHQN